MLDIETESIILSKHLTNTSIAFSSFGWQANSRNFLGRYVRWLRSSIHRSEITCCPSCYNHEQPNYGKYGMLLKRYQKEHQSSVYYSLLMSGKLNQHLSEVDMLVHDTVSQLLIALAKKQGID